MKSTLPSLAKCFVLAFLFSFGQIFLGQGVVGLYDELVEGFGLKISINAAGLCEVSAKVNKTGYNILKMEWEVVRIACQKFLEKTKQNPQGLKNEILDFYRTLVSEEAFDPEQMPEMEKKIKAKVLSKEIPFNVLREVENKAKNVYGSTEVLDQSLLLKEAIGLLRKIARFESFLTGMAFCEDENRGKGMLGVYQKVYSLADGVTSILPDELLRKPIDAVSDNVETGFFKVLSAFDKSITKDILNQRRAEKLAKEKAEKRKKALADAKAKKLAQKQVVNSGSVESGAQESGPVSDGSAPVAMAAEVAQELQARDPGQKGQGNDSVYLEEIFEQIRNGTIKTEEDFYNLSPEIIQKLNSRQHDAIKLLRFFKAHQEKKLTPQERKRQEQERISEINQEKKRLEEQKNAIEEQNAKKLQAGCNAIKLVLVQLHKIINSEGVDKKDGVLSESCNKTLDAYAALLKNVVVTIKKLPGFHEADRGLAGCVLWLEGLAQEINKSANVPVWVVLDMQKICTAVCHRVDLVKYQEKEFKKQEARKSGGTIARVVVPYLFLWGIQSFLMSKHKDKFNDFGIRWFNRYGFYDYSQKETSADGKSINKWPMTKWFESIGVFDWTSFMSYGPSGIRLNPFISFISSLKTSDNDLICIIVKFVVALHFIKQLSSEAHGGLAIGRVGFSKVLFALISRSLFELGYLERFRANIGLMIGETIPARGFMFIIGMFVFISRFIFNVCENSFTRPSCKYGRGGSNPMIQMGKFGWKWFKINCLGYKNQGFDIDDIQAMMSANGLDLEAMAQGGGGMPGMDLAAMGL